MLFPDNKYIRIELVRIPSNLTSRLELTIDAGQQAGASFKFEGRGRGRGIQYVRLVGANGSFSQQVRRDGIGKELSIVNMCESPRKGFTNS